MVCRSRRSGGAITVTAPSGRRLKIPSWMLSPAAAETVLSLQASMDVRALLSVADLVAPLLTACEEECRTEALRTGRRKTK